MDWRDYDSVTGRMNSFDPEDQSISMSGFAYCGNNPISHVDPSGRVFQLLPFLAATIFSGHLSGMISEANGGSYGKGFLTGAVTGAIGGALAPYGGGTFLNNVLWGAGEGALTGGISSAINGGNFFDGAGRGALWGAGFATMGSGIQSFKNLKDGYGFGTNYGRMKSLYSDAMKSGMNVTKANKVLQFMNNRYKLNFSNISYQEIMPENASGVTWRSKGNFPDVSDPDVITASYDVRDVWIGPQGFRSLDILKQTVAHEYGHFSNFEFINGAWNYGEDFISSSNNNDGLVGYGSEFNLSSKMRIPNATLGRKVNGYFGESYYNPLFEQKKVFLKPDPILPRRNTF